MVKLLWAVLCKTIITDQETQSVSYIQTVEAGNAVELPVDMPSLSLGTVWECQGTANEEFSFRINFRSPSGDDETLLTADNISFEHSNGNDRLRINAVFEKIHIKQAGRHEFHVQLKEGEEWVTVSVLPLKVTKIPKIQTA